MANDATVYRTAVADEDVTVYVSRSPAPRRNIGGLRAAMDWPTESHVVTVVHRASDAVTVEGDDFSAGEQVYTDLRPDRIEVHTDPGDDSYRFRRVEGGRAVPTEGPGGEPRVEASGMYHRPVPPAEIDAVLEKLGVDALGGG